MWLILLDASGSMADPFGGKTEFEGRVRETKSTVKIDAAKEALILHLKGLGTSTDTAIFAFRQQAELIYEGPSAQNSLIESALAGVSPHGGTDIAAALAAAGRHVDAHSDQPIVRVLLISDGLSDAGAAEAAASDLRRRRVLIDAILIDPTNEGGELVRRVIGGSGLVTAVTSTSEMSTAVGEIGEIVRREAAAVSHAQSSLKAAIAKELPAQPSEEISFTAAHPSELAQNKWASLLVFIHLTALQEEARNRAIGSGRVKGADLLSPSIRGSSRIGRETEITFTPRIAGFDVNPAFMIVRWSEDIQDFEFRIRPSHAAAEPVIGEVEASVRGLPIARIPLAIQVRPPSAPRPGESEPKVSTGGAFKTVFASYARTDLDVVEACANVYAGLGIYTIIDKMALVGGQAWRPAIRALMAGSDTFQLFWSNDASVSPPVREEILDAIVLQGDRGTGFIRPTYWTEPPPPLPAEVSDLNFAFLNLDVLKGAAPKASGGRDVPLQGAPRLPVVVLPLLPGTSVNIDREIIDDTSFAVAFIEKTAGARYYPVPTLLVDRYTVQSIRASQTVDFDALERARQKALLDWASVIRSIAVSFHVHHFWGSKPELGVAAALRAGFDERPFDELRRMAEGGPYNWLLPSWARPDRLTKLNEAISVRDAAAMIVEAALASDLVKSSQRLKAYRWKLDAAWMHWRAELEPLGLKVSGNDLHGSGASLGQALSKLWEFIEPVLLGSTDRFGEPVKQSERFDAAVDIAGGIIEALQGFLAQALDFVRSELHLATGWRSDHARLLNAGLPGVKSGQTFFEFADAFFDAIKTVLRQRIQDTDDQVVKLKDYDIPATAWRRAEEAGLVDGLTFSEVRESGEGYVPRVELSGPISAFVKMLDHAWAQTRAILVSRASASDHFIVAEVPTYGIFAPRTAGNVDAQLQDKAREWDLRHDLILPGTDRVLLCGEALDDFRAVLTQRKEQMNTARLFLRSVLVHEHFHAFLETAPMRDGAPPPGPGFVERWNEATPVNEALAAWMQVHMARDSQPLTAVIHEFISAGPYPEWPYAGAETIERVYEDKGIEEIRSLIQTLRSDPPLALAWMEKHRSQGSSKGNGAG